MQPLFNIDLLENMTYAIASLHQVSWPMSRMKLVFTSHLSDRFAGINRCQDLKPELAGEFAAVFESH
jgi:hypothetical protein